MRAASLCVLLTVASCAGSGSARVELPVRENTPILPQQIVPADAQSREDAARSGSLFVGRPAPDFTLVDQKGGLIGLDSLRGQWVVVRFFPPEDLPDCVCNANADSDSLWRMQEIDAAVIAVGPFDLAKSSVLAQKYGLSFSLVCDASHAVARDYDTLSEDGGRATIRRETFVVDPEGTVAAHWPLVVAEGHAARVKAWLDANRLR